MIAWYTAKAGVTAGPNRLTSNSRSSSSSAFALVSGACPVSDLRQIWASQSDDRYMSNPIRNTLLRRVRFAQQPACKLHTESVDACSEASDATTMTLMPRSYLPGSIHMFLGLVFRSRITQRIGVYLRLLRYLEVKSHHSRDREQLL